MKTAIKSANTDANIGILLNRALDLLQTDVVDNLKPQRHLFDNEVIALKDNQVQLENLLADKGFMEKLVNFESGVSKINGLLKRLDPVVYLAVVLKNKDIETIIGRANYTYEDGKRVSLRVYVGRLDEFKNGVEDTRALTIAKDKIRLKIQKLFPFTE